MSSEVPAVPSLRLACRPDDPSRPAVLARICSIVAHGATVTHKLAPTPVHPTAASACWSCRPAAGSIRARPPLLHLARSRPDRAVRHSWHSGTYPSPLVPPGRVILQYAYGPNGVDGGWTSPQPSPGRTTLLSKAVGRPDTSEPARSASLLSAYAPMSHTALHKTFNRQRRPSADTHPHTHTPAS